MSEIALALLGLAFAAGVFALAIVLPIVGFVRTSRALREAARAHDRIEALARVVQDLARERREAAAGASVATPAENATPAARAAEPSPFVAAGPSPTAADGGLDPTAAAPQRGAEAPSDHVPGVPTVATVALEAPEAVLLGAPTDAAAIGPVGPAPELPSAVGAPPILPPGVSRDATRGAAPAAHLHRPSLEQRIGKRWLLYIGIGAIVLGASYLAKLAFDNDWITPAMQVGLIALSGGVLVGIGLRFADRGLTGFGHVLAGGGIAVLYVAVFAALHLYELVDRGPAFAAMVAVTALSAWLADRRSDLGLATVALLGGFATPFLVGGDRDAYVALFTYLTVLGAGAAFLARRHAWPLLTLAAFALTTLSFGAWAAASYRGDRYLVVQGFLTIWLALFLLSIKVDQSPAERGEDGTGRARRPAGSVAALHAGVAVIVEILAPVLYHAASLSNLVRHTQALLVYFILVTLVAVLYAAEGRRTWARLIGWLAAWLPYLGWLSDHPSAAGARVTLFALFGLHLIAELRMLGRDRSRLETVDTVLLHLNGLGLLAGLLVMFPRWDTSGMALATAGVAGGYAMLAVAMRARHESAPWHYVALASACAAGALALRFEGAWVTAGWAVEGTFLVWLGLREQRPWLRACGSVLLALATWHGLESLDRDSGVARVAFANAAAVSVLAIAAMLGWIASRYSRTVSGLGRGPATPVAACLLTAAVLILLVITNEINRLYGVYAWQRDVGAGPMAGGAADLARQVTLSIVWAAYGVILVALGIARRYAPIRYLAIALLAGTIGKVLFVDLAQLDRVYRVLSVIGLGVLLIVASYLYQRFMADEDGDPRAGEERPQAGEEWTSRRE